MKTRSKTLPSGVEATIRRPGWSAMKRIENMLPAHLSVKVGRAKGDTDVIEHLTAAELDELRRIAREQRIERVCAAMVEPKVTPETIDDVLDYEDFEVVEREIVDMTESEASEADPSLAMTGS